ncbi:ParB/RepB/Spo0J family partition protein [Deinococcus antarcticus]|uniref:ParB/RepB/Spo0J family partition protein n=1 Tax=Deinococcus antarcticus TaxID=1298767 RepID=A0ABV8A799_9DEIO
MAREDLLGDGLANLASQGTIRPLKRTQLIPAPWQPRRHFEKAPLLALARSIRSEGVRQNLIVRPHPSQKGHYEVIAGERRWRASDPQLAEQLNLTPEEQASLRGDVPSSLPCLIVNLSDSEARRLSAIENLQRENLDPVDEASYRLLLIQDALELKFKNSASLSELAREVGRRLHSYRNNPDQNQLEISRLTSLFEQLGTQSWESYTTNQLPLLQLPDELLNAVRDGLMAGRSALLIHRQSDPKLRQNLTVRALEGASFKELTALVDQQQGETWRSVAADVKSRLGVRQLERLEPARRTRVLKLLEKLQQELQGA